MLAVCTFRKPVLLVHSVTALEFSTIHLLMLSMHTTETIAYNARIMYGVESIDCMGITVGASACVSCSSHHCWVGGRWITVSISAQTHSVPSAERQAVGRIGGTW